MKSYETSTRKEGINQDNCQTDNDMWSYTSSDYDGRIPLVKLQLRGLHHAMNNKSTQNVSTIFSLDIERKDEDYPKSIHSNNVDMRKSSTQEARKAQLRAILDDALRIEHVFAADDFQTDRHETA